MYKLPFHFKLYICGFFGVPEPQGARCFGPLGVGAALTTVKDALKTRSRSRKKNTGKIYLMAFMYLIFSDSVGTVQKRPMKVFKARNKSHHFIELK